MQGVSGSNPLGSILQNPIQQGVFVFQEEFSKR